MFDGDSAAVEALRDKGRWVICYFSADSSENWRRDFAEFDDSDKDGALAGRDENWLDIRSVNVQRIMVLGIGRRLRRTLAVSLAVSGLFRAAGRGLSLAVSRAEDEPDELRLPLGSGFFEGAGEVGAHRVDRDVQ